MPERAATGRLASLADAARPDPRGETDAGPAADRFLKTGSREVLVVDDQVSIQHILAQLLAAEGYEVKTAGRVDEAIAVLRHDAIDAVVLDVRMPGASGLELLEFIRRDPALRDLPVLILTGVSLTRDEEAAIARHGAYVFYKAENFSLLITYLDHLTRH